MSYHFKGSFYIYSKSNLLNIFWILKNRERRVYLFRCTFKSYLSIRFQFFFNSGNWSIKLCYAFFLYLIIHRFLKKTKTKNKQTKEYWQTGIKPYQISCGLLLSNDSQVHSGKMGRAKEAPPNDSANGTSRSHRLTAVWSSSMRLTVSHHGNGLDNCSSSGTPRAQKQALEGLQHCICT